MPVFFNRACRQRISVFKPNQTSVTYLNINLIKQTPPAVLGIIIVNVLFFAVTLALAPGDNSTANPMDVLFALHFPQNDRFHIWQLVSHMFMHGSFTHILFNMFGIYTFGIHLERMWGARRFLIFYFISGIGAALVYTGIDVYEFGSYFSYLTSNEVPAATINYFLETGQPVGGLVRLLTESERTDFLTLFHGSMLGASGALYGVLVAFALLFPNAKLFLMFIPVPVAAKYIVPGLICLDLFSGFTGFSLFGGGIAHFAHIGGALIGFLLMKYWKRTLVPPDTQW